MSWADTTECPTCPPLTTADLGSSGAAIEGEEARRVIEGLRARVELLEGLLREAHGLTWEPTRGHVPDTLYRRIYTALGEVQS